MAITLRHQTVASTWSQIVEGGAGHEKEVMQTTYNFIEQARIPNVKMTQEEVRMGTAFGRRRDFIILTHERPLHEFIMWLGARDYGANLEGGWYVTYHPKGLKVRRYKPDEAVRLLDLFAQQDLYSFVKVAGECLKTALKVLYKELELEPPSLDTKGRGFLEVW